MSQSTVGRHRAPGRYNPLNELGTVVGRTSQPLAKSSALLAASGGLVAAIAQEEGTGDVLMMAWMNDEALARTLATRKGTYYSRSRQQLWVKGETSGHVQEVVDVRLDCDGDTVLLIVDQVGAACHTGDRTCFDAGDLGASVGATA